MIIRFGLLAPILVLVVGCSSATPDVAPSPLVQEVELEPATASGPQPVEEDPDLAIELEVPETRIITERPRETVGIDELKAKRRRVPPLPIYVQYTAYLVNRGSQPVTVVLPGDGSSCGWRTPVIRWNPRPQYGEARCLNINPLKLDEVISLGPGQRVKLGYIGGPQLTSAGKHLLSVEMEHIRDLKWSGIPLPDHDAGAMEKVRQIKGFKAVSNVVEIEVLYE